MLNFLFLEKSMFTFTHISLPRTLLFFSLMLFFMVFPGNGTLNSGDWRDLTSRICYATCVALVKNQDQTSLLQEVFSNFSQSNCFGATLFWKMQKPIVVTINSNWVTGSFETLTPWNAGLLHSSSTVACTSSIQWCLLLDGDLTELFIARCMLSILVFVSG